MKKLFAFAALISFVVTGAAFAAGWNDAIDAAVKRDDYNQINIVAASNPEAQGEIATYLLQLSQNYQSNPQREVKLFKAATPFVGRISAANAAQANDVIAAMLKVAADPTFQAAHPHEAGDIFLSALLMSGQPNLVAYNPNLHAEVLEAADDFIKQHPEDADKRLQEEVSLAQAGGAPEVQPRGVINPSAD